MTPDLLFLDRYEAGRSATVHEKQDGSAATDGGFKFADRCTGLRFTDWITSPRRSPRFIGRAGHIHFRDYDAFG